MSVLTYLGLGSNLGDRRTNLARALHQLEQAGVLTSVRVSSLYESEPYGFVLQPAFYNAVVGGDTELTPDALLRHLKWLERKLGREESQRWGPRLIDLDILLWGDLVHNAPHLCIPHLELVHRNFVVLPLYELDSQRTIPGDGRTVAEIRAALLAIRSSNWLKVPPMEAKAHDKLASYELDLHVLETAPNVLDEGRVLPNFFSPETCPQRPKRVEIQRQPDAVPVRAGLPPAPDFEFPRSDLVALVNSAPAGDLKRIEDDTWYERAKAEVR